MSALRVCPRCSTETDQTVCPDDGAPTIPVQAPGEVTYPAGTVIADRYRVETVLGVGGFGAVYKCTQLNMNQTVAVKVLRSEHLSSVEHVKRFTREAQAASKLRHPNTIHIFDFGVHSDGALYLAMEFVEGETLGHRIDTQGPVHWEALVHILIQVCHSLTEAHAAGLVHRDLKPENIMLLPVAGDPNFVKVLDFGIAKVRKDAVAQTADGREQSLTEAGMIMGTPAYMSPEQAKGEPIDARCDIYALGVIMYESLTGKPPFHGESAMTVLVSHIKDMPRPIPRDGSIPNVPREIEAVVLQCLAKEPERRPQTTVQLVDHMVTARTVASAAPKSINRAAEPPTILVPEVPTESMPAATGIGEPITGAVAIPASAAAVMTPAPPVVIMAHPSHVPLWIGIGAFTAVAGIALVVALLMSAEPSPGASATPAIAQPSPAAAEAPAVPPVAAGQAGSSPTPMPSEAVSAHVDEVPRPASAPEPTAVPEPAAAPAAVAKPMPAAKPAAAKPVAKAAETKVEASKPVPTAKVEPVKPEASKEGPKKPPASKSDDDGFRLP
jgi:serine/threonine-protein kinase